MKRKSQRDAELSSGREHGETNIDKRKRMRYM
jgi:hypothetical protein